MGCKCKREVPLLPPLQKLRECSLCFSQTASAVLPWDLSSPARLPKGWSPPVALAGPAPHPNPSSQAFSYEELIAAGNRWDLKNNKQREFQRFRKPQVMFSGL